LRSYFIYYDGPSTYDTHCDEGEQRDDFVIKPFCKWNFDIGQEDRVHGHFDIMKEYPYFEEEHDTILKPIVLIFMHLILDLKITSK
jgi:hypothetical protein